MPLDVVSHPKERLSRWGIKVCKPEIATVLETNIINTDVRIGTMCVRMSEGVSLCLCI